MGVTVSVSREKNYSEILWWLQENIGPMLHSQPLSFWHGRGWHIKASFTFFVEENRQRRTWEVEIDDEQLATAFALKWA